MRVVNVGGVDWNCEQSSPDNIRISSEDGFFSFEIFGDISHADIDVIARAVISGYIMGRSDAFVVKESLATQFSEVRKLLEQMKPTVEAWEGE